MPASYTPKVVVRAEDFFDNSVELEYENCEYYVTNEISRFNVGSQYDRYGFNNLRDAVRFCSKLSGWWRINDNRERSSVNVSELCDDNPNRMSNLFNRVKKELKGRKLNYRN